MVVGRPWLVGVRVLERGRAEGRVGSISTHPLLGTYGAVYLTATFVPCRSPCPLPGIQPRLQAQEGTVPCQGIFPDQHHLCSVLPGSGLDAGHRDE
jgi:hypothetical protein